MMKKLCSISVFWAFFLSVEAQLISRIESNAFNKGQVKSIYLAPGLISMIVFPCDVDEVSSGRSEDLRVKVSPTSRRILQISLKSSASMATNMIVRCGKSHKLFVFDIIPGRGKHQDLVEINSTYGSPGFDADHFKQVASSDDYLSSKKDQKSPQVQILVQTKKLVASSESLEPVPKKTKRRVIMIEAPRLISE